MARPLEWEYDAFVQGKDNLAYDLSLQGCYAANEAFHTNANSYYLSFVTGEEEQDFLGWKFWGDMNVFLREGATYQAQMVEFTNKPIPNWGTIEDLKIEAWHRSDGAVSSISQRYPFTHHAEPIGGQGILEQQKLDRGKWSLRTRRGRRGSTLRSSRSRSGHDLQASCP